MSNSSGRDARPPGASDAQDLGQLIREMVVHDGPITFARFMEMALYHPELGYYTGRAEKLGPRGDFYTSPETHPAFGALVGRQLAQIWAVLDRPNEFTVVEVGAGSGSLSAQILRYASQEEMCPHLRYIIVEKSPSLARRQREFLNARGLAERVVWFEPTADALLPDDVVGCFVSNELVDAFPVHRVMMREGQLREVYVGVEGDRFVETIADLSTPALQAYFSTLGIELAEGARGDVNLEAPAWIRRVAGSLARGYVITMDYGFPAEDLFSPKRREGTLMCYYRHTYNSDPYAHVGDQDLTAHVDFSSLILAGREAGLRFVGLVSQSRFLSNLGIDAYVAALDGLGLSSAAYYDNKFAMRRLIAPNGMGEFKVLIQGKSVYNVELDCLNPCNDRKREMFTGKHQFEVPLLEPAML